MTNEGSYRAGWNKTSPGLTRKQKDEIQRRYLDGETAISLALEFGVKAAYIYTFCRRGS